MLTLRVDLVVADSSNHLYVLDGGGGGGYLFISCQMGEKHMGETATSYSKFVLSSYGHSNGPSMKDRTHSKRENCSQRPVVKPLK